MRTANGDLDQLLKADEDHDAEFEEETLDLAE